MSRLGDYLSMPTPLDRVYAWHANAMLGLLGDDDFKGMAESHEDPEAGWFKRRLVKGGPFVPARIWLEQEVDEETGELVADEVLRCEVNGQPADPVAEWSWLCGNPISKAEFDYLTSVAIYAAKHAPNEPIANPRRPVNWGDVPTPKF